MDISKALEKVKRLEEMKTEPQKRILSKDEFVKWMKENNAEIDGFAIAEFPGYELGLKVEKAFEENELVMKIPRKVIFSMETAAPELQDIKNDPLIHHLPQVGLSIALLVEKHKADSNWKPYLDILPNSYNTVLYMTTDDMIELKGSPTLGKFKFFKI